MVNLPSWPPVAIWQKEKREDLKLAKTLLDALGSPHKKLPPTIHVAGTNGKWSTVAILKSIFKAAGYKVHSYNSPHLLEFNERINLAGKNISDYHLFELLEQVRIKAEELVISIILWNEVTYKLVLYCCTVIFLMRNSCYINNS